MTSKESQFKSMLVPQQVRQGVGRKRKLQGDLQMPRDHVEDTTAQLSTSMEGSLTGSVEESIVPTKITQPVDKQQTPEEVALETKKSRLEQLKSKEREAQGKQGTAIVALRGPATLPKSSEDVQSALKRAREKLRGAMQKRDLAMQRLSPVNDSIAPISALSADLIIKNVAATGSKEKVFFPTPTLGAELGRSDLVQAGIADDKKIPSSLTEKKLRLQRELQVLKEKLEKHQKIDGHDSVTESSWNIAKLPYTREELEKRKEEAQAFMDISHWKLFVSKQEGMMEEVNNRVLENRRALSECERDQRQTTMQLEATKCQLGNLQNSENAVLSLISSATSDLLHTRDESHIEQQNNPS